MYEYKIMYKTENGTDVKATVKAASVEDAEAKGRELLEMALPVSISSDEATLIGIREL